MLKANSKPGKGERKKKKVDLLGTFEAYKDSKKQIRQQEQMQAQADQHMQSSLASGPLPTPAADTSRPDLKKKK